MRYFIFLSLLLCLSACTTTHSLGMSPQQIQIKANAGELDLLNRDLMITLQDGSRNEVTVINVTEESIISDENEYFFKDIVAIESNDSSSVKTAGAVVGGTLLAGLVVVLVVVDKHK